MYLPPSSIQSFKFSLIEIKYYHLKIVHYKIIIRLYTNVSLPAVPVKQKRISVLWVKCFSIKTNSLRPILNSARCWGHRKNTIVIMIFTYHVSTFTKCDFPKFYFYTRWNDGCSFMSIIHTLRRHTERARIRTSLLRSYRRYFLIQIVWCYCIYIDILWKV